ncbi:MAG: hypothetical protein GY835_15345 [bacterium]|nr:hypothetical protein [bacterium]
MKSNSDHLEYWLREILTLPTAPFHEEAISRRIKRFAAERKLKVREDRAGNLVVEYRKPGKGVSPVAFTGHMDHPGFEVVEVRGRQARLRLLGGVDEPTLRNSTIRLYTSTGTVKAEVRSVRMAADRRKQHTLLDVRCDKPVQVGDWGQFDLVQLSLADGKIRSVALDNVCSVALILALLDRLAAGRRKGHVYGVFTACEEVGFVGALELVRSGILPKRVPLVVLETSRELPSFKIGAGPVIRVGDRLSVYNDFLTRWLTDTAGKLAEQDDGFRFQRALMPGGMCEATLYQLEGWSACALALALANYHNMGRSGAAAEWVSRRDAEDLLLLLEQLVKKGPGSTSADKLRSGLERQYLRYRHRFQQVK